MWSCVGVPRIHLIVDDATVAILDRAVAQLALRTSTRQTRTSFIVRAIEAEAARLQEEDPPPARQAPTPRASK